ncbi:hypothetical protein GGR53DRAFT_110860 [Hypoxylon sp. FL1150]|nr:hypothetical protein GGR53DRAFT_110860 [Hypoxylon sp. FL1150]
MSTAPVHSPKQRQLRQPRQQSRSRSQTPRSTPNPKKKKATKKTKADESADGYFPIRGILDERIRYGRILYKVDWEGTDTNGRPYESTWVSQESVTEAAIKSWEAKKAGRTESDFSAPTNDTVNSTKELSQQPDEESDSLRDPNWHRQVRNRKRSLEDLIVDESESDTDTARKRLRRQTENLPRPSKSVNTGSDLDKYPQGKGVGNPKLQGVGNIGSSLRDITGGQGRRIVVELPRDPEFDRSEYARLTFSQETASGSKEPPYSSRPPTAQARDANTKRDERQVIPDSQGTSQDTLGTFSSASQQGTSGIFALRPAISASASQNQASPSSNKAVSQPTSSQAAQIVLPLSSQHDQLATQSRDNFTVYDDSVSAGTGSKNQIQSTSQSSSQALNELDGNTRSAPSSNPIDLEPRASTRVELSQGQSGKHAGSDQVEDLSTGQSILITSAQPNDIIYTPHPPATSMDMDTTQPAPLSARERLKAIREANFAKLDDSTPPSNLTRTNESSDHVNPSLVSHASGQGLQNIEVPAPDISPLTPTPLVSPTFLTQPLPTMTQNIPSEQQSLMSEVIQGPAEQEQHNDPNLENSGPSISYGAPPEEQPATLDPSTLTLSIENDMDITPSVPMDDPLGPSLPLQNDFEPHEEAEIPQYYPTSLLPYIPTGTSEYLVTLPFHNSVRPVYNDILRENEELIRDYNASFRTLPYRKPHPTTLAKLDEMFSRLFDVCDLPPFMETLASMNSAQITKHVLGTNAKFAFVAELLNYLADVDSDKKILILARPGKVIDLLGQVVETRGYRYIRSGLEIVSSSSARHSLTVAVSSTLDSPASIPEDVDVVMAFDHTYQPNVLPASIRERSPLLMILTNAFSIQHINMRIADNIEPLERKNALAMSLVKAMRYVEDADVPLISRLPETALTFANYIQLPDDDDVDWKPLEVPEDVFENLHVNSQLISQPSLQGLINDQLPGSRKRSHEDEDDETSSKRLRISQPTVVTNISHISNTLKNLIGDDFIGDSSGPALSVSINRLETMAAKIDTLEAKVKESKRRERQFRDLSDRSNKEVKDYSSTVRSVQKQYMVALKDRGIYEAELNKTTEKMSTLSAALESKQEQYLKEKEKNAVLEKKIAEANELLANSSNPELVRVALLEKEVQALKTKVQQLEKKVAVTESDMEYAKNAYQDASQRAGELQSEKRALEQENEELRRKADDNVVEVNRIQAANEARELVRMLDEQKSLVRDRDAELGRAKDELKTLRESRRGTRQSSVPRSPRLSAFSNAVNSPRNGARGTKAGSSSRGTSPAPPPTGVFEAGSATPASSNRQSNLRETRF